VVESRARVADSVARSLAAHGVRRAFGMPGGEVVTLVDALGRAGIPFTLTRNETAGAIAAAGFGLLTGGPGLLVTTLGPGLANAVNGIADAMQERMPLVVVSGAVDGAIRSRYTHQILDQAALLRGVVKGSLTIERDAPAATVARAVRLATAAPMGPVHIDLAPGTAAAECAENEAVEPTRFAVPGPDPADPSFVEARAVLCAAERPLILAGFDAARAGAGSALVALARQHRAPVITTYKGKGVIDESDPLSLGAAGLSPNADAILLPLVRAADVVLLVGYDPIEMRPGWLDPFAGTRVIELQSAPVDHGMHRADLVLTGALPGLVAALADEPDASRWPGGEPVAAQAALRAAFAPAVAGEWGPHQVFEELRKALPAGGLITIDSGAHRILLSQMWRAQQPLSVLQSAGWCTMGAAVPLALGAKLARPDRPVVAVVGDGGLEMTLGELGTLRDEAAAIVVLVLQDESLALIELKQRQAGLARAGVGLGLTDYAAVARAFGGHGETVDTQDALGRSLAAGLARQDRFTLIAARIAAERYRGAF
jgi:acetolactate synthase I/II/III large subunit